MRDAHRRCGHSRRSGRSRSDRLRRRSLVRMLLGHVLRQPVLLHEHAVAERARKRILATLVNRLRARTGCVSTSALQGAAVASAAAHSCQMRTREQRRSAHLARATAAAGGAGVKDAALLFRKLLLHGTARPPRRHTRAASRRPGEGGALDGCRPVRMRSSALAALRVLRRTAARQAQLGLGITHGIMRRSILAPGLARQANMYI